jgi:hypothetical protein
MVANKKRIGCLALFAIPIAVVTWLAIRPSLARRSLPRGATEINEYYADSRFGSDFVLCLRAKIQERDFAQYAKRLRLNATYEPNNPKHSRVHWPSCPEPWWTPPSSLDGAHIELIDDPNYYALAKYHEGYVYFGVFSW